MIRIAHTNIRVTDPVASLEFYEQLGLRLAGCMRIDPMYLLYLAAPGDEAYTIELTVNPEADASYDRTPGSGHVALCVGDIDAFLERLADAGIHPESPPFNPGDKEDVRVCFVVDPDGVRVELMAGTAPMPQDSLPDEIAGFVRED
ncbi:MAG: VOC family protein [Solirubrobacteraceae bacterium]